MKFLKIVTSFYSRKINRKERCIKNGGNTGRNCEKTQASVGE